MNTFQNALPKTISLQRSYICRFVNLRILNSRQDGQFDCLDLDYDRPTSASESIDC